jgi:Glycosyltransferase Family 4
MPDRSTLLIITFTDPERDPRVYRQLRVLSKCWDIVLCACGSLDMPGVRCIELENENNRFSPLVRHCVTASRAYERAYWSGPLVVQALRKLDVINFDVVLANDVETLPLALRVANFKTRVVLDAHEYEPRHWDDQWLFDFVYRPYWDYICRTYLPHVDGMVTVSPRLADEYSRNYNVECGVIMNTPDYQELFPSETHEDSIRVVHHGGINPSRKIENMMAVVGALGPRFTLDLMLVNNHKRYMKYLRKEGAKYSNIHFVEPVPMPDIAGTINKYDMGIFMLHPGAFNYRYSLPNKLFEYIQARLAIAIWPSPEMSRIVKSEDLGVVSSEYTNSSMASSLEQVTSEEIRQFKINSNNVARKYSAEIESVRYRDLVGTGTAD